MAIESSSRNEVLRRVRAALGGVPADGAVVETEWEGLARGYRRAASLGREDVLEMLEDRLRDYDATVVRVSAGAVGAAIAGECLPSEGRGDWLVSRWVWWRLWDANVS